MHRSISLRNLTLFLFLIAIAWMLTSLSFPLLDRTETRVAEVSREILVTGNWTTLHLNFEPYYDKPPLLYWLCATSFRLFGNTEFAARLIPACASLVMLSATLFFASRWFGATVGLLSSLVLFLSVGFVILSRFLASDALLTCFTTLALLSGFEGIRQTLDAREGAALGSGRQHRGVNWRWLIVCGLSCGLGFLSKGPVCLVLVAVPWLSSVFFLGSYRSFPWSSLVPVVLASGAVVAPWLLWTGIRNPNYLIEFLYLHNVQRFAGEFHPEPFWFFIPVLLVGGHPWSFLTLPFLRSVFRRNDPERLLQSKASRFLLLSAAWCLTFFSLSQCKLPTYIFPAAPPLSMAIAVYLWDLFAAPRSTWDDRLARWGSPVMATLTTVVAIVAFQLFDPQTMAIAPLSPLELATTFLVVAVSAIGIWQSRWRMTSAWGTAIIVMAGFALWMSHSIVPTYSRQVTIIGTELAWNDIGPFVQEPHVATVGHQFPEVSFYTGRNDIPNLASPTPAQLRKLFAAQDRLTVVAESHVRQLDLQAAIPPGYQLVELQRHRAFRIFRVARTSTASRVVAAHRSESQTKH